MLGLEDLFPQQARTEADDIAPVYEVSQRKVVAIEHPCIIKNLDRGIKSFGPNPKFHKLVTRPDSGRAILPLWLRPESITSKPVVSHGVATNNVLLKITVPKRTGRSRKRGTDQPFVDDGSQEARNGTGPAQQVNSVSRQDKPKLLLRKLQDNADKYDIEAVGSIKTTHRYRGLADFQFATEDFPFMSNLAEHLIPLQLSKLKQFKLNPDLQLEPGQEIIPPPHFTDKVVPFNYFYDQNPFVRAEGQDEEGKPIVFNINRKRKTYGHYIAHNAYPVPNGPLRPMDKDLEQVPQELVDKVRAAMDERPIWTRRALANRVGPLAVDTHLKIAIATVGYQFKGGPWRDAVVKYGVDPREDPKYRPYQTLAFKLHQLPKMSKIRQGQSTRLTEEDISVSHKWDGESFCTNGKFWQICDVTDPSLLELIEKAPVLDQCDITEGGFWPMAFWYKVKAYMKARMIAIQAGRYGYEDDNPKKKGYLYTSHLLRKLSEYPDVLPIGVRPGVTIHSLLYGMEDVSGLEGMRYRHRPMSQDAFGNPVDRDAETMSPGPSSAAGGIGGTPSPEDDDPWAHILDTDLSGASGDEDEDEDEVENRNADGDDAEMDEATMMDNGSIMKGDDRSRFGLGHGRYDQGDEDEMGMN
ncbi:transcription factor tau subunit sfc4 [Apiospora saccharicola]|uniref:Transcription factor tau subunit sfc4 n=1 Tax=Apiospora saccharicola TaxID=335842 RepID=A0ABR1TLY8_9PEZI